MIILETSALGIAATATALAMLCRRAPWIAVIMVLVTTGIGVVGTLGHWSPAERPDAVARWVGWLLGACGASLVAILGQQEREDHLDALTRLSVDETRAAWGARDAAKTVPEEANARQSDT